MNNKISIDKRNIGVDFYPYVIAEMSANHNGNIDNAYKIIDMAKSCGADAIKLQTYSPDTLTLDVNLPDFIIEDGLWQGQSLYELFKGAYMPWDWHKLLFDYANKINLTIFSSPFDISAVDLLEDLNTPAYKIASFELIDLPLIKYVAQTGKPIIMSTGMANEEEIDEAIETAKDAGGSQLAILHCVSSYPALAEDYNLNTMVHMQKRFLVSRWKLRYSRIQISFCTKLNSKSLIFLGFRFLIGPIFYMVGCRCRGGRYGYPVEG